MRFLDLWGLLTLVGRDPCHSGLTGDYEVRRYIANLILKRTNSAGKARCLPGYWYSSRHRLAKLVSKGPISAKI